MPLSFIGEISYEQCHSLDGGYGELIFSFHNCIVVVAIIADFAENVVSFNG